MKSESAVWLGYAQENLSSAKVLLTNSLYNPSLQNVQQCVEKALKAILLEQGKQVIRTHSITELVSLLGPDLNSILSEDECSLLDSIYLPSKYPVGSALPDFSPDEQVCAQCLAIAERVYAKASKMIAR